MGKKLVVGVGNAYRGDDAAGLLVVQGLRPFLPPDVRALALSGEGTSLMDAWEGADWVVLADAVQSGAAPGTIHQFTVGEEPLPTAVSHTFSSHAFGVAEAVEMGRLLGRLPRHLTIWGIEGVDFRMGADVSPVVRKAITAVIAHIRQMMEQA